jgi:hypothetical protein
MRATTKKLALAFLVVLFSGVTILYVSSSGFAQNNSGLDGLFWIVAILSAATLIIPATLFQRLIRAPKAPTTPRSNKNKILRAAVFFFGVLAIGTALLISFLRFVIANH